MVKKLVCALLLAGVSVTASAAPATKDQLLVPPSTARHFTISSKAGKHGDNWVWTLPDGRIASRMSM